MSALDEFTGLISSKIATIKTFFTLIRLETKLAGLSVFPFILNLAGLFAASLSLWLTAQMVFACVIYAIYPNSFVTACLVFCLNLIIVLGLVKYLSFNLRKMSFEKTRQFLVMKEAETTHELEKRSY